MQLMAFYSYVDGNRHSQVWSLGVAKEWGGEAAGVVSFLTSFTQSHPSILVCVCKGQMWGGMMP